MKNLTIWTLATLILLILNSACDQRTTNQEKENDFFNQTDLSGWHVYNRGQIESKWTVVNGDLLCDPKKDGVFGDLVSDRDYEEFEMEFEWKVGKGGNSGVFINVQEDSAYAAVFATGLEMQLLGNEFSEPRHQVDSTHWAGCLYAVDCIGSNSKPRPYGKWNQAKILQKDGHVTFWVNGEMTFDQDVHTADFEEKVRNSNMKNYPDFGKFSSGKIAFQNHTDSVAFRNIRIKEW